VSIDLAGSPQPPPALADIGGITMPSTPSGRGGFLDDVIVELGFATPEAVEAAVEEAREPGKVVGRVLVDGGEISEDQLARAIAERNGLPFVDLERCEIDPLAQGLIGRADALRYRAIPIAFAAGGALVVALADPLDSLAVSDIAVMTRSELIPVVANARTIEELADGMPDVASAAGPPGPEQELDPPFEEAPSDEDPMGLEPERRPEPPRREELDPPSVAPPPEPLPVPEPVRQATPERAALRGRLVDLVEAALEEAAGSELEQATQRLEAQEAELARLRDSLARARERSVELETALADLVEAVSEAHESSGQLASLHRELARE
jgi:hypothetical protein